MTPPRILSSAFAVSLLLNAVCSFGFAAEYRVRPIWGDLVGHGVPAAVRCVQVTKDEKYLKRWLDYMDDWAMNSTFLGDVHPVVNHDNSLYPVVTTLRMLAGVASTLPYDSETVEPAVLAEARPAPLGPALEEAADPGRVALAVEPEKKRREHEADLDHFHVAGRDPRSSGDDGGAGLSGSQASRQAFSYPCGCFLWPSSPSTDGSLLAAEG